MLRHLALRATSVSQAPNTRHNTHAHQANRELVLARLQLVIASPVLLETSAHRVQELQELALRAHLAQACNSIGMTVYALPDSTSMEFARPVTQITIVLLVSSTHSSAQLARREQSQTADQIVWLTVCPATLVSSAPATVKVDQVVTLRRRAQDTTLRREQSSSSSLPALQASKATLRRQRSGHSAQSARPAAPAP